MSETPRTDRAKTRYADSYCISAVHELTALARQMEIELAEALRIATEARIERDALRAACKDLVGLAEREGWIHVAINNARAAIGEGK